MEKELIIHSTPTEVQIALLEDKKLVELHSQKTSSNFQVGDVLLGRIQKFNPGMNAAFVDIGFKKPAFLHYTDLGPKLRSLIKFTNGAISGGLPKHTLDDFKVEADIIKTGKIGDVLGKKGLLLVQIMKEPIASKAHRLSCDITIPGRYMVLAPFSNTASVSKKISKSEERKRLLQIVESIRPRNFGLILRTAAEGVKASELQDEIRVLMSRWAQIHKQLHKANGPCKILSELDKTSSLLRDFLNDSFTRIVTDSKEMHDEIRDYLKKIAPDKIEIAKLHNTGRPVFEQFGVTRQIKSSFGKTSTTPNGSYIVIERTEAMHVIDVNSGHRGSTSDQETSAYNVNLEAAEEVARQLRLRDIGGIIMVDFIDMRDQEHKKELLQKMKEFMLRDAAKHTILPLSKFGLMQITRQRVRPEVNISTTEVCPSCNGTGEINSSVNITDNIERDLEFVISNTHSKRLTLEVHPFLEAWYTKGLPSRRMKLAWKYKKKIKIRTSQDLAIMDYKFYGEDDEEIRMN